MRRTCTAIAWLLALTCVLSAGAWADVRLITDVPLVERTNPLNGAPAIATQYGWNAMRLKSESGARANGGLTAYLQPAKGSPGPTPPGHYFLLAGESGSDGKECAQQWIGTDYYDEFIEGDFRGPKLSSITKLSYYAILEKRGDYYRKLMSGDQHSNSFHIKFAEDIWVMDYNAADGTYSRLANWDPAGVNPDPLVTAPGWWEAGATVINNPHYDAAFYTKYKDEYQYSWFAAQPPAMVLYISLADGNRRVLIYRPWSTGTDLLSKGFGPKDGSLANRWKKYDTLTQGYWYNPMGGPNTDGTYMYTWAELVAKYPGAYIAKPGIPSGVYNADGDALNAPTASAINFTLGALDKTMWPEAYAAQGGISKFEIAFSDTDVNGTAYNVDDEYNFARAGYGTGGVVTTMLNNAAMFEKIYMPAVRTRAAVNWGAGSVVQSAQNAVQLAGNYNFYGASGAATSKASQFVVFGKVLATPAPTDSTFVLDDGSGKNILVYSGDGFGDTVFTGGEYVRVLGNCRVPSPYDWVYNFFHIVALQGSDWTDPNGTWTDVITSPQPAEFHTYSWKIEILRGAVE